MLLLYMKDVCCWEDGNSRTVMSYRFSCRATSNVQILCLHLSETRSRLTFRATNYIMHAD